MNTARRVVGFRPGWVARRDSFPLPPARVTDAGLRFQSRGPAVHEAVINDLACQEAHAEEMGGDAMHHGDSYEPEPLVVGVGETGDLVYTAGAAGTLIIGGQEPGHWDAGMRANLSIT